MAKPSVTIYSTPTWASCNAAKEFLSAKGIVYASIDISQDVAARQEVIRLSGKMATPVIVVDGEVVVGFDRGKLQRLLGIWGPGGQPRWSHEREDIVGATVSCPECGRALEVPAGARAGEIIDCPTWAGVSLRLSRQGGDWRGSLVKRASCAVGEEQVVLPEEVQPGDIIECHGVRQRVTYEYGAWALERLPEEGA